MKVWDLVNGQELFDFHSYISHFNVIAIMPDEHRILSVSEEGSLKIWTIEKSMETSQDHMDYVTSLAIIPNDRYALSASSDGVIKLWNLERFTETYTLQGHTSKISALIVTPDG